MLSTFFPVQFKYSKKGEFSCSCDGKNDPFLGIEALFPWPVLCQLG